MTEAEKILQDILEARKQKQLKREKPYILLLTKNTFEILSSHFKILMRDTSDGMFFLDILDRLYGMDIFIDESLNDNFKIITEEDTI